MRIEKLELRGGAASSEKAQTFAAAPSKTIPLSLISHLSSLISKRKGKENE